MRVAEKQGISVDTESRFPSSSSPATTSRLPLSVARAAKLDSLYKDHNRMLPLNGIILHRNFETMLYQLWVLHDESMAVCTAAESGNIGKAEKHTLTERTISGSELLRHDLDMVTMIARELFSEICMVDEASEKWDRVIADSLLNEYKQQTESRKNVEAE